jgi:replicative DNA helicase
MGNELDLRIPPQDIDMEKSVLSSLLMEQDFEIFEQIQPFHFYRNAHQTIFTACKSVFDKEKTLDIKLVIQALGNDLEKCGGASAISLLMDEPPPSNPQVYCAKLIGLYKLRKVIEIANAACKRAFSSIPDECDAVLDYMMTEVSKLDGGRSAEWCKLDDLILDCVDICGELQKRQGITGVPSGFKDLDFYTCGFQPGDLIIIAGRPGSGKTSLAINAAKNSGRKGFKNGFASLEMVRTQIGNRFLSMVSGVNSLKFRSGRFVNDDWEKINDAAIGLSPLPVWIDDSPRATYIDIQKKARGLKRNNGLDILWIDYLGFLDGDKTKSGKVHEIESITRGLKSLAKELMMPVVLICQLNRECERRDNKRPMLSDLRDSGAIEQDADLVILLYNDSKYNKDTTDFGVIECEIAKQRNGPTARIKLAWNESITRFDNLERITP